MKSRQIVIVGLLAAGTALAQNDWPQWRGAARDGSASFQVRGGWPPRLIRLWEREVGGGYSGPLVSGKRIWVHSREGDQEVVSSLSLDQGTLLWNERYAAQFEQHPSAGPHGKGPFSTPAFVDGRLFTLGITNVLSAWDAETGLLLWRRDYSSEFEANFPYFGASSSPLVWEGSCYVHFGGHDREKPDDPGYGAMTALSVCDGRERWRWTGDAPALGASPIVSVIGGRPQLVFKTEQYIVGLDPRTGEELWRIPFKVSMDNSIVTPLLVGDLLVTSDYQMGVYAWRISRNGGPWTPTELWRTPQVSMFMSSPVLSRGQLVGFSHTRSGELFGLDPADGRLLWRGEPRWGEHASLIACGDDLLVFLDGSLVVGRASPDRFRILQRYPLGGSSMWAHPAISSNRIIVRNRNRLVVFQPADPESGP